MSIDLNKAAKIMVETEASLREWRRDEVALQNRKGEIESARGRAHEALSKCVGANVRDRAFTVEGSVVVVSFAEGKGAAGDLGERNDYAIVKVLDANGGKA